MNNKNVMELYEAEPANSGPYALTRQGKGAVNKANFIFFQELKKG